MDFDPQDIVRSPFAVGAVGAVVTAFKFTPGASWPERAVNVVVGSLVSGVFTPVLTEWLKLTSPQYTAGAAFMLGLLSMSILAALMSMVRDTKWSDILTGWVSRR